MVENFGNARLQLVPETDALKVESFWMMHPVTLFREAVSFARDKGASKTDEVKGIQQSIQDARISALTDLLNEWGGKVWFVPDEVFRQSERLVESDLLMRDFPGATLPSSDDDLVLRTDVYRDVRKNGLKEVFLSVLRSEEDYAYVRNTKGSVGESLQKMHDIRKGIFEELFQEIANREDELEEIENIRRQYADRVNGRRRRPLSALVKRGFEYLSKEEILSMCSSLYVINVDGKKHSPGDFYRALQFTAAGLLVGDAAREVGVPRGKINMVVKRMRKKVNQRKKLESKL